MNVADAPLVLLAAGRSSRMGRPKGLLEVAGVTLLEAQLQAFAAAGGARAVVVLGASAEAYAMRLRWASPARGGEQHVFGLRCTVTLNALPPELGPFASLLCGLEALRTEDTEATFVLPVDVPAPGPPVWIALAGALTAGVLACVPARGGRKGHPVLLARSFSDPLVNVPLDAPEARLDVQLGRLDSVARVAVAVDDDRVVANVNTPGDWERVARAGGLPDVAR